MHCIRIRCREWPGCGSNHCLMLRIMACDCRPTSCNKALPSQKAPSSPGCFGEVTGAIAVKSSPWSIRVNIPPPPALPQPDQSQSPQKRQGPAKDAPLLGRRKDQARPLCGPCNSLRGEAQERCPTPFLPWRSEWPPAAKSAPW